MVSNVRKFDDVTTVADSLAPTTPEINNEHPVVKRSVFFRRWEVSKHSNRTL